MSSEMNNIVNALQNAINAKSKKGGAYDTSATVTRIDGNTAWVHIPGGVDETPAKLTINASEGDTVQVRVSNGRAFLIGNATSPPTDDTTAIYARKIAYKAENQAASAQETADDAQGTAVNAKETAEAILVYDHDYRYVTEMVDGESHLMAIFEARLYRGGVDIHATQDPELFTWYLKTEDGTTDLGYGYTKKIDTTECGYGAEVIGKYTTTDDATVLDINGNTLTDTTNTDFTVRADGESVRVRDLTVSTTLYPTEKILIVGNEDEHLVTVQTLSDVVDKHYVFTQGTPSDIWEIPHNLNKYPSVDVVDSAGTHVVGDIEYIDVNNLTVTFSGGFAGKAYLN